MEFLDKGRAGMASTFLTRLRVGPKLVDAKGVSRIYRSQIKTWHLVLLVLSGLLALVTALLVTDVGWAIGSLIVARIRDCPVLDQGTLHCRRSGPAGLINFRYHIVSLMAVFIALAVGIAAGVSLGPSVDQGLQQQAAQDRKQVSELRAELDRRNALDEYREAYDQQVGEVVDRGSVVSGVPRRPGRACPTRRARSSRRSPSRSRPPAGRWSARSRSDRMRSIPAKAETVENALRAWSGPLGLNDDDVALDQGRPRHWPGRSRPGSPRIVTSWRWTSADALTATAWSAINRGSTAQAQLVDRGPRGGADRARRRQ